MARNTRSKEMDNGHYIRNKETVGTDGTQQILYLMSKKPFEILKHGQRRRGNEDGREVLYANTSTPKEEKGFGSNSLSCETEKNQNGLSKTWDWKSSWPWLFLVDQAFKVKSSL